MTDDALDLHLARALRAYADEGVRRIDAKIVAETAIRNGSRRRLLSRLSRPGPAPSPVDFPSALDFEGVIVPLDPPAAPASPRLQLATGSLGSVAIVLAAVVTGVAIGVTLPWGSNPVGVPVSPPSIAPATTQPSPAATPSDAIRPERHDIRPTRLAAGGWRSGDLHRGRSVYEHAQRPEPGGP
jgi:hypothetical protein